MRTLLINPPSVASDLSEIAPPLGLYVLASVARQAGHDALVWDGNVDASNRRTMRFYDDVNAILARYRPDLVATTSMVVNTHIAVEILRHCREQFPQVITVAGGPHFSAFAGEAVRRYHWIDYIVQGEGEAAFQHLLNSVASGERPVSRILMAPVAQAMLDRARPRFGDIPWSRYYKRNARRTADYETSRGCVFRCAFCYSPSHWGVQPRYISDDVVLDDLRQLALHGVRHVFFVDDNFLNDTARARRLCEALSGEGLPLQWFCYATLNRLTVESIDQMAAAGCVGVFVGIDAVTAETRRLFKKGFLNDVDDALRRLARCIEVGIRPTCALIVRGEAVEAELNEVVALAASLRQLGCAVRLNPLIGYQSTAFAPSAESASYTEARVRLMLDGSPLLFHNDYAKEAPYLFPYHCATRAPTAEEIQLREVHAAATVVRHFPESLLAAIAAGVSLWKIIIAIASEVRSVSLRDLRNAERTVASRLLRSKLRGEAAVLPVRELLIARLASRANWIRTVVRVGSRQRLAAVRPFLLDDTGTAPRLLVAACGSVARVFEIDQEVKRGELAQLSTALRQPQASRQVPSIGDRTAAALTAGGLLRFLGRTDEDALKNGESV